MGENNNLDIMRNSYKVISFDMNGTLTQDHFVELVWGYGIPRLFADACNMSLDDARTHVFREYDKVGEDRIEWYDVKYWFRTLSLGSDWRTMLESFQHAASPFPDAKHVLGLLHKNYDLVVTSNAPTEFIQIELGAGSLERYFKAVFSCTSDFGEVKKTPEVYRRVCDALGVAPEEVVHVGDHPRFDYDAPRSLGIRSYHLDRKSVQRGDEVVHNLLEFYDRLHS